MSAREGLPPGGGSFIGRDSLALRLTAVVAVAALANATARASTSNLTWEGIYFGSLISFLAIPFAIARLGLRVPMSRLGFTRPQLEPREAIFYLALAAVVTVVAVPLLSDPGYLEAYQADRVVDPRLSSRVVRFLAYTASATLPFEIMHRGFLLFGLHHLLSKDERTRSLAWLVSVAITAAFEVVLHLEKPPLEVVALLVGSPILSAIALRTRSIVIPVLAHLHVEVLFFAVVLA